MSVSVSVPKYYWRKNTADDGPNMKVYLFVNSSNIIIIVDIRKYLHGKSGNDNRILLFSLVIFLVSNKNSHCK